MANKKAAKKTTAMTTWDSKFAQYAQEASAQVKNLGGGGPGIKFRAGVIEVAGTTVPGNKLECIILGSCAFNAWYEEAYDSDNPQPPDCYAFALLPLGRNNEDPNDPPMTPHDDAESKQSEDCAGCPKNQWGSADKGRGKACGNRIRIGLLLASDLDDADSTSSAEVYSASVSPTNLKAWAGYVKSIVEDYGRPTWAVVTTVSSLPDPNTQIRLEFKFGGIIEDDDILQTLEKRYLKIQDVLQQPFGPKQEVEPKKKVNLQSKKFAGKAAVRR